MMGHTTGWKNKANGNKYFSSYKCGNYALYRNCISRYVRSDLLEAKIKEKIIEMIEKYVNLKPTKKNIIPQKSDELEKLKMEYTKLKNKENNIIEAIIDGYKKDLFKDQLKEINRQIENIEKKIKQIKAGKNKNNNNKVLDELINIKNLIPTMSQEEFKLAVSGLLKIEVDPDSKRGRIYFPNIPELEGKSIGFRL